MRGALPQAPAKWASHGPVCFDCLHVQIVETGVYAMAKCELLPWFRPFGLHWTACRNFAARPLPEGIAHA